MSPDGNPQWTIRYETPEEAPDVDPAEPGLAQTWLQRRRPLPSAHCGQRKPNSAAPARSANAT
jgi:hypothetical protein